MIVPALIVIIALLSGVAFSLYTTVQRLERTCLAVGATPCPAPPQIQVQDPRLGLHQRDRAVNNDPLYPPLNRGPDDFHVREGTFRPIGYLVPEEGEQRDSWKLFGREKDRHRAEFYATSTDRTMDIKVFLSDDIVTPRLRDMYSIPAIITIDHPMFVSKTYRVVENPKSDLSSAIYV